MGAQAMITKDDAKNAAALEGLYAPPCMYLTQRWVNGAPDEACVNAVRGKQWFSFVNKNNSGWNSIPDDFDRQGYDRSCSTWLARLNSMLDQCPATISMNGTEPEKDKVLKGNKVDEEYVSPQ